MGAASPANEPHCAWPTHSSSASSASTSTNVSTTYSTTHDSSVLASRKSCAGTQPAPPRRHTQGAASHACNVLACVSESLRNVSHSSEVTCIRCEVIAGRAHTREMCPLPSASPPTVAGPMRYEGLCEEKAHCRALGPFPCASLSFTAVTFFFGHGASSRRLGVLAVEALRAVTSMFAYTHPESLLHQNLLRYLLHFSVWGFVDGDWARRNKRLIIQLYFGIK